jgi:hypothetical protein
MKRVLRSLYLTGHRFAAHLSDLLIALFHYAAVVVFGKLLTRSSGNHFSLPQERGAVR